MSDQQEQVESMSVDATMDGSPEVSTNLEQKKKTETAKDDSYTKNTLFVSTLPFDATSEDLAAFFQTIGPIRSCFVVKKKNQASEEKTEDIEAADKVINNGCGYVQFAMAEDAQRALLELKKVKFQGKRTLRMSLALKKKIALERKGKGISVIVFAD